MKRNIISIMAFLLVLSCSNIKKEAKCSFKDLKSKVDFTDWNKSFIDDINEQKKRATNDSSSSQYVRNKDLEDVTKRISQYNGDYLKDLLFDSISSVVLDTITFDSVYYIEYHISGEARINGYYIINFRPLGYDCYSFYGSRLVSYIRTDKNPKDCNSKIDAFVTQYDSIPYRHTSDESILLSKLYNLDCKLEYKNRVIIRPPARQFIELEKYLTE